MFGHASKLACITFGLVAAACAGSHGDDAQSGNAAVSTHCSSPL